MRTVVVVAAAVLSVACFGAPPESAGQPGVVAEYRFESAGPGEASLLVCAYRDGSYVACPGPSGEAQARTPVTVPFDWRVYQVRNIVYFRARWDDGALSEPWMLSRIDATAHVVFRRPGAPSKPADGVEDSARPKD